MLVAIVARGMEILELAVQQSRQYLVNFAAERSSSSLLKYYYMKKKEYQSIAALGIQKDSVSYLYDRYSNSMFVVPELLYLHLDDLLSLSISEFKSKYNDTIPKEEVVHIYGLIEYCKQKLNLLRENTIPFFSLSSKMSTIEKVNVKLNNNLTFLCINVTESCNLRCDYCVFSGKYKHSRVHNNSNIIDWEIVQKGLDLFLEKSNKSSVRKIGFYGGEPLLNFDIIKKTIDYATRRYTNIIFTITTNGILLKDEILSFLVENNVEVVISFDGPKEIHDKNRKLIDNKGSFEILTRHIDNIKLSYPHFFLNKLGFSVTLTPNNNIIEKLLSFFTYEKFPMLKERDTSISVNYVNYEENDYFDSINYYEWSKNIESEIAERYKKILINGVKDKLDIPPVLRALPLHREMMYIHFRSNTAFDEFSFYWLNGSCLPGMRSIFLDSRGIFLPCEKVNLETEFQLGNVYTGLDTECISRMVDEYSQKISPLCSKCWAFRFCGECWTTAIQNNKISSEFRSKYCNYVRDYWSDKIEIYMDIITANPNAFDYAEIIDSPEFMSHMVID